MKFTRKGFFKSIFGGAFAAIVAPSVLKAESNTQNEVISAAKLTLHPNGDLGIGETVNYHGNGKIGLGTNTPTQALHVSSIIFHVNDRRLQMGEDENGDFKIRWLDVKDDESSASITIQPPKPNPFKVICNDIRYS